MLGECGLLKGGGAYREELCGRLPGGVPEVQSQGSELGSHLSPRGIPGRIE